MAFMEAWKDKTMVRLPLDKVTGTTYDSEGGTVNLKVEIANWFRENISDLSVENAFWHHWGSEQIQFCFRDPKDAMLFKLTWGGE